MRGRAILFTGREQVHVATEEVGRPEGAQVLVRARATLVSTGTECIVLAQAFEPGTGWASWGVFPFRPGYSLVGEIVAAGPDARRFAVGQRVAVRRAHADFAVADEAALVPVPDAVADHDAAWFGLASIVQNGIRRVGIGLGDDVAVIGVGILGQLACQYARLCGARSVTAIDTAAPRLETARRLAATHVLAMSAGDAVEPLRDITGGRLADVVIDVTGAAAAFQPGLALAGTLGRYLLLGDTGFPSRQSLSHEVLRRGITIVGAHDVNPPAQATPHYRWTHAHMQALFFDLVVQGRMRVAPLRTDVVVPEDAPAMYRRLLADRAAHLGVVFDWTHGR